MVTSELSKLLRQRGHEVVREGDDGDILLPKDADATNATALKQILYGLMRNDTFRRTLRDWSYGNTLPANQLGAVESYVSLSTAFDKAFPKRIDTPAKRVTLYSHTFEWYISELMRNEFAARASGFNIRLQDADPGDESDCIALIDNGLVFVECKTGKGDLYHEVERFVRRDVELSATYSLFIFDRDYTFQKSETDLPEITVSDSKRLGLDSVEKVSGSGCTFYRVVSGTRYFLVSPGFKSLHTRVRHMLRYANMLKDGASYQHTAYSHEFVSFAADEPPAIQVTAETGSESA